MTAILDDDVLREMFAELAESVEVPADGAADALAAIRAGRMQTPAVIDLSEARDRRRKRVRSAVGIAAAVVILGGVAVATTRQGDSRPAAGRALSSAGPAVASGTAATKQSARSAAGPVTAAAGAAAAPADAPAPEALPSATTASGSADAVPDVDSDRVIRTGDVTLVVPTNGDVAPTVTKLAAAATTGLGGYLQDSATQQADPKSGGIPTASVTLRVPADKFDTLVARVEALGTVVTSMTNGKDVTAQYVDLDARLKALETSRETYLVILSKAQNVSDTLAVQQRLDDLQQQIEQLQGQQNELKAQSDLSTLTVEVSGPTPKPKPVVKPPKPKVKSGLAAAFDKAGDRFRRGTESVIAALGTIALLAIAALVLFVGYRVGRRYYLRRSV